MIHEIKQKAINSGFDVVEGYRDDTGLYAYRLRKDGEEYCLVAKKYAYKNRASFMREVALLAVKNDLTLIFYDAKEDQSTVFDPLFVESNGSPSQGKSKTRETEWIELSLEYGVPLGAYLQGKERPQTLAGSSSTLDEYVTS